MSTSFDQLGLKSAPKIRPLGGRQLSGAQKIIRVTLTLNAFSEDINCSCNDCTTVVLIIILLFTELKDGPSTFGVMI
jgi:hypothetical protein